ncbi:aladin-like [Littorina saxatilis]|uniref:Aladin seven-bladed propeller domain-containing protein n=1 Tax=Littorina saxatilis TaxID=31220 RepID=A0AAN9BNE8_9CAEN
MSSLMDMCQPPPPADCVSVMEKDGEMKFVESKSDSEFVSIEKYPEVLVSRDHTRATSQRENIKSAFIPADRTVWQRALLAWQEHGLPEAFEEIVNSKDEVHPVAASGASALLRLLRTCNSLSGSLFPHMSLSNEELVIKYAEVAGWDESPVHAFAWHPHTTKFALALQDDSVHVHYAGSTLTPVLKHKFQKCVAHLAWQPLSASVLAVACQSAVLIWHIEPTSLAARPSTSSVQVLQHRGHCPVTHLAWDPAGKLLLSASSTDTAIMAWNVPSESCTPLRYIGGGGFTLLAWSPDGDRVMAAAPSTIFRVWETVSWNCEVWSQLSGRCTSACWSHDGEVLLFSMEEESVLHAVKFNTHHQASVEAGFAPATLPPEGSSGASTANVVADLSEVVLTSQDGEGVKVGGFVHQMVWNRTSERLAVLFKGTDNRISPYVAIFKTTVHPLVQVLPSGFVKGHAGEVPHHISFQPSFDKGALLTAVWSSGRVSYVPMYFVLEEQIGSFQFQSSSLNGHGIRRLYTDLM